MNKRDILLCTLGLSWQVIPEVFFFINLKSHPFYNNHPEYNDIEEEWKRLKNPDVSRIWVISSDAPDTDKPIENLKKWWSTVNENDKELKIFRVSNTGGVSTFNENRLMAEAILKLILHARLITGEENSRLFLSLAGGRKTMSSYMQKGGFLFGADGLLHVTGDIKKENALLLDEILLNHEQGKAPHPDIITTIRPCFIGNEKNIDLLNFFDTGFEFKETSKGENIYTIEIENFNLSRHVEKETEKLNNIARNFRLNLIKKEKHENFRSLYMLSKSMIENLQETYIGRTAEICKEELNWLETLPKADLHCHLGGCQDVNDLIEIANLNLQASKTAGIIDLKSIEPFLSLPTFIEKRDITAVKEHLKTEDIKDCMEKLKDISKQYKTPQYLTNSLFISYFSQYPEMLDKLIYGSYLEKPETFRGINISNYMAIGDFGGSGILQTESALKRAIKSLYEKAVSENVRYMEVRCSPANYTKGGLSLLETIKIIKDEFNSCYKKDAKCRVNLIFIATRHSDITTITQEVAAAVTYSLENKENTSVVGFDLAGMEETFRPSEFRKHFLPLFRNYLKITVHAGEHDKVESIWEAIYELHADRLGHALNLNESLDLLKLVRDRKTAIEMCPSSNFQTLQFKDFSKNESSDHGSDLRDYPLYNYFTNGLNITINTDNRAISRTTLSNEYLMAAKMTKDGLSKWDILNIIKIGFKNAFLPLDKKEKMIKEIDEEIYGLLKKLKEVN